MTKEEDIALYTVTYNSWNPIKHMTFDKACDIAKRLGVDKFKMEKE